MTRTTSASAAAERPPRSRPFGGVIGWRPTLGKAGREREAVPAATHCHTEAQVERPLGPRLAEASQPTTRSRRPAAYPSQGKVGPGSTARPPGSAIPMPRRPPLLHRPGPTACHVTPSRRAGRNAVAGAAAFVCLLCLVGRHAAAQRAGPPTLSDVVARYERVAAENPTNPSDQRAVGLAYLAVEAFARAEDSFRRALQLDPHSYAGGFWLGRTQYLRGKYEAAAQTFEHLAAVSPNRYETHADWGLVCLRLHQHGNAERRLARARSLLTNPPADDPPLSPPAIFDEPDPQWRDNVTPLALAEIDYYLALAAFEQGDMNASLGHCDRSLDASSSARARYRRGLVLSRLNRQDEAQADFVTATELDPTLDRAHYQLALLYFRQGDEVAGQRAMARFQVLNASAAALEEQRKALLRNPDKTSILVELGRLRLEAEAYEEAAREFQKAAWHDPTATSAFLGLSHAYAMLGRFDDALRAQSAAADLEPDSYGPDAALGFILLRQAKRSASDADYESALAVYRRLTERDAADGDAWLHRGEIAHKLSLLAEARNALDTWAEQPSSEDAPASTHVQVSLAAADVCLRLGDLAAAERHYRDVLRRDPEVVEAYFNMGFIATRLGRAAQAVRFYEIALDLRPEMSQAHYLLGRLYAEKGDRNRARSALLRAIELDPDLAEAYERLAHLHGASGDDLQSALDYARKSVALRPRSANNLNTLSWVHYLLGDYARAEKAALEALRMDPDNRTYREGLGAIRSAAEGPR